VSSVSVIVPFHNTEQYLARCVESLLSQSVPRSEYEVFLVDNNSTDGSAELVRRYPSVRLLTETKPGSYAARNRAIGEAKGEILAFTDSDCEPASDWLARILEAMELSPVGILLGRRGYARDTGTLSLVAAYEAEKAIFVSSRSGTDGQYGYTNNMAVRRTVFDRIGLFPERMRGGDTIFVRRAVGACGSDVIQYCSGMTVRHLEITRVTDYYRKQAIYGRSNEELSRVISFRPLTNLERWEVFRRTIRRNGFGVAEVIRLFLCLGPGAFWYETGRSRARLKAWWARRSS
jgi:glycosyltransferase involved in cell wall biosynthesis